MPKTATKTETIKPTETESLKFESDLGLSAQALSVLHFLSGQEWGLDVERFSADMRTYAWYNGRERAIAVTVKHSGLGQKKAPSDKRLVLVFGEHRNTDGIFLDKWEDNGGVFEPPTTEDFTEEAYAARRFFDWGAVGKVADAILKDVRKFLGIKM